MNYYQKGIFLALGLLYFIPVSQGQNCAPADTKKRIQIHNLIKPFDMVAQLVVYRKESIIKIADVSTCSFISKNVFITAGHTFKHKKGKTHPYRFTIYLGKMETNGKDVWLDSVSYNMNEIKLVINPIFQASGNADFDYSYVALPKNFANTFFNVGRIEDLEGKSDSIHITGYPGDERNRRGIKSEQLWNKGDLINNVAIMPNVFLYSIFTFFGDSGAPIWLNDNSSNYYLIGVHGTGVYSNHRNCNAGIKFNTDRINELQQFIKANQIQ